ncbi:MFS transporter [Budvicia aquatica]|uniref:D-galactarate permease n=1 Tax=Budvicia aquatica TaxID=82979 RepID=A0A2C6DSR2_9GAMM|nr:MFS transporter [Budvicia aquatica]PHI31515.1 MFS transporter [Budvicia aquatica]VFS51936.1 D-galactarate permease [Budvicia aquatica]
MSNSEASNYIPKWKSRYTVLGLIWLAWMLSYLDRMVMNISLPFIGQDLGVDKGTQGLIISSFFVGYALFQIPGGYLADKFGPRISMAIAILWWSAFTTLTGVISSLGMLLLVRVLFGIGEGAFPSGSWKTIATYFPSKERGRATAIQSSVGTLGPALASIVAASIIAHFGWRHVFVVLGIPGILITFGIYYFCRNNPKDSPGISQHEIQELENDKKNTVESKGAISISGLFRSTIVWQLTGIWFLFNLTFWGFTSWLPSYLMESRGLSLTSTGYVSAVPFLFGTVGGLFGGYISDRFKQGRSWIYAVAAIISATLLYLTFSVENLTYAIIYQCFSMLFMFFSVGIFWGLLMDSINPKVMGTASGIVNVGAQLAGVIAPPVMGFLIDVSDGNYSTAFIFIIISLALSALVALTINIKKTDDIPMITKEDSSL